MASVYERAYAKINLGLDVIKKREDGYHELSMIMQTLELHDDIYIEETNLSDIDIVSSKGYVKAKEDDIAYKAARLICDTYNIKKGIKIRIEKHIPVAAGLAGGSSDCSAVLRGLNRLFKLELSTDELRSLGLKLGADVPYCITGGTYLSEGIGEKLTRLNTLKDIDIILIKPNIDVSTKYVYENLHVEKIKRDKHPDIKSYIEYIKQNNIKALAENISNILECVTADKYKIIDEIKKDMLGVGALGSIMSGSGPTVFGIFESREAAIKAEELLSKKYNDKAQVIRTCMCSGLEEYK